MSVLNTCLIRIRWPPMTCLYSDFWHELWHAVVIQHLFLFLLNCTWRVHVEYMSDTNTTSSVVCLHFLDLWHELWLQVGWILVSSNFHLFYMAYTLTSDLITVLIINNFHFDPLWSRCYLWLIRNYILGIKFFLYNCQYHMIFNTYPIIL